MQFEIKRKIVHISEGLTAAALVYYDLFSIPFMTAFLVITTLMSIISREIRPWPIDRLVDEFDREEHEETLPGQGSLFLLAGSILAVAFFEKNVALAAIATLTVGDSVSALIGIYLGEQENPLDPKKSVEGSLAGFAASTVVNLLFLAPAAAVFVSAIGMTVESLTLEYRDWEIDDNLTIPVSVGLAYLVFEALIQLI